MVHAPTSNRTPPTRPYASAWLETSMTAAVAPRSSAAANSAWRSVASGVVRTLSTHHVGDAGLDGADHAGDVAGGAKSGLDEVGGGRLAGRPGDPDDGQARGRVAIDGGRDVAEHGPRVIDDEYRPTPDQLGAGGVGEHRDRTLGQGLRDELGAVASGPGQGHVEIAGPDGTAVVSHPGCGERLRIVAGQARIHERREIPHGEGGDTAGARIAGHGT